MPYRSWRPEGVNGALPTLYLLHGVGRGDDENTWHNPEGGNLGQILGTLVAGARLPALNVVTVFGRPAGLRPGPGRFPHADDFHDYVLGLVAAVEADAAVSAVVGNPRARAIAGLSMGGWQAVGSVLRSPGFFAALGNFSGAVQVPFDEEGKLRPAHLRDLPVLYTTCGQQDPGCLQPNREFVRELSDAKIPETHDFLDGQHDWAFWRGALHRFALRLTAGGWGRPG